MPLGSVVIWSRSVGSFSEGCFDAVAYVRSRDAARAEDVALRERRDGMVSALLMVGVRNIVSCDRVVNDRIKR